MESGYYPNKDKPHKIIPLTGGAVALVDEEDFELVSRWKWKLGTAGYAQRNIHKNGRATSTAMHRILLEAKAGQICDHINGDKLDNRKQNLRICSFSENMRNRLSPQTSANKYKGIYKNRKKWSAQIMADGVLHYLGSFLTEEGAAQAYNEAAIKFHGKFAKLNEVTK